LESGLIVNFVFASIVRSAGFDCGLWN